MNLFRNATDAQSYPAGSVICRQDEPGSTMFAIVEGEVEILVGDEMIDSMGAGEFFGEMSLIDHSPRSATVRAKSDCRLVAIDDRHFNFMVQQTPFFALEVMRALSRHLRKRMQEPGKPA